MGRDKWKRDDSLSLCVKTGRACRWSSRCSDRPRPHSLIALETMGGRVTHALLLLILSDETRFSRSLGVSQEIPVCLLRCRLMTLVHQPIPRKRCSDKQTCPKATHSRTFRYVAILFLARTQTGKFIYPDIRQYWALYEKNSMKLLEKRTGTQLSQTEKNWRFRHSEYFFFFFTRCSFSWAAIISLRLLFSIFSTHSRAKKSTLVFKLPPAHINVELLLVANLNLQKQILPSRAW